MRPGHHTGDVPSTAPDNTQTPLTDAYRLLRRVSPPQAPFAGWLGRRSDGVVVQLVAGSELANAAGVWSARGGHVLGVTDLVRCADGHLVELPWCGERADRFLERRHAAHAPLTPGEAVTLAVSVVRGTAEATAGRRREVAVHGYWWLTDTGRPVFVPRGGAGVPELRAGGADLLHSAARDADPVAADALRAAAAALQDPATEVESELFALAEPQALAREVDARVRSDPSTDARPTAAAQEGDARTAIARYVDADIAHVVGESWDRLRQRLRRPGRTAPQKPRRRVWLVAASAAVLVAAAGVLWPDPSARTGAVDQAGPVAHAEPAGIPAPDDQDGSETKPGTGDAAWVAGVEAILQAWLQCGDDACRTRLIDDPSRLSPTTDLRALDAPREVVLLDDFGDVAVVRVDPEGATSQIVVVIRTPDALRLRDVYAAQPQ